MERLASRSASPEKSDESCRWEVRAKAHAECNASSRVSLSGAISSETLRPRNGRGVSVPSGDVDRPLREPRDDKVRSSARSEAPVLWHYSNQGTSPRT